MRDLSRLCVGLLVVLSPLTASLLSAAVAYNVTPLTAPGGTFHASQINDHREVVGGVPGKPMLWLPQAKYGLAAGANDLSTHSGYQSDGGVGINNHGQIVGYGHGTPFFTAQPVMWLPAPAYGRPAGWSVVEAVSGDMSRLNDAGQMVGHHHNIEQAMVWLPAPAHGLPAGRTDIPTPGWAFGNDINENGYVAGRDFDGNDHGFLFLPEPALGRAAGVHYVPTSFANSANAVNIRGTVVGSYRTQSTAVSNIDRAFVWRVSDTLDGPGGFFDLGGVPDDATHSDVNPSDINDLGQVVGRRLIKTPADPVSVANAFLWTPTGGMVDLNTLIDPNSGWVLHSASSINAAGDIVGVGRLHGVDTAYMLTVPEPSAAVVTSLVAAALLRVRSRRRPLPYPR